MNKLAIVLAAACLAASLPDANAASPFVKAREKKAAEKSREREEKAKEKENAPAPAPQPASQPSRPRPDKDRGKTPDYYGQGRDSDRNRDRDRNHDHDGWNRPRTVIIERPVYIPTVPIYDPYTAAAAREDALLEAVARQMRFALREDPILKPFKLDTDTVGDSVEIEGQVDTIAQLQLALDVARNIDPRTRIVITRIKVRQN